MEIEAYYQFIDDLRESLETRDEVLGLVLLGSTANQSHLPDNYSDHDFFVITKTGLQARYRQDLSWLPDSESIVFWYRETDHAVKVLYQSGHLLEVAVFDPEELKIAKVNDYRLVFDKANLQAIVEATYYPEHPTLDDRFLWGQFLSHLVVGYGRLQRGEALTARFFLTFLCVTDIAHLMIKHLPTTQPEQLDTLDPLRRLEVAYPILGKQLNTILSLTLDDVSLRLHQFVHDELIPHIPDAPVDALDAIYIYLKANPTA